MRLIAITASLIVGLLVGLAAHVPWPAALLAAAGAALAALLLSRRRVPWWPAALACVALLGLARGAATRPEASSLSLYNGAGSLRLEGLVIGDPEQRGRFTRLVVDARAVNGQKTRGRVLVWARPSTVLVESRGATPFRYGDLLRLEGTLSAPEPFQDFDYPDYLAKQGIGSIMTDPRIELVEQGLGNRVLATAFAVRRHLADSLARSLPGEQAAVAQAFLLGLRSEVPQDLNDAFRATGTSHVLAISGQHVAMLLALAVGASAWAFGRRRGLYLLAPLLLMWGYALVSGFSPPVERAAVMGTVYLAALALGRPDSVFPALALATGAMAAAQPRVLLDVSFQLSATSVAGMALIGTPLAERWSEGRLQFPGRRAVALAVAAGVGATLATLPLIAFNFHRVSLVGIPATLLLLPAVPLMLVASAAAALAGLAHPVAGQVVGWVAWVPLTYMAWLVGELARLPGATFTLPRFSGALVWGYYAVAAWLFLAPRKLLVRPMELVRGSPDLLPSSGAARTGLATGLALAAVLVWGAALSAPDGRLHVLFLDVGQGDAALIITPGGRQVLVDGGPDPRHLTRQLGRHMPFWDRSLDLVVSTHPQRDHLGGLPEVLRRYTVAQALESPEAGEGPLPITWRQTLTERRVPVLEASAGQRVVLDSGVVLEVLAPGDRRFEGPDSANNNGVVLRLLYGESSFLFTADIEAEGELLLLARHPGLGATVLKVAHHGSDTSTTPDFLQAVSPHVAVVSVGLDNTYGHPSHDVIERLHQSVPNVYLTCAHGTVEVTTDGSRLWVRSEKRRAEPASLATPCNRP